MDNCQYNTDATFNKKYSCVNVDLTDRSVRKHYLRHFNKVKGFLSLHLELHLLLVVHVNLSALCVHVSLNLWWYSQRVKGHCSITEIWGLLPFHGHTVGYWRSCSLSLPVVDTEKKHQKYFKLFLCRFFGQQNSMWAVCVICIVLERKTMFY